jgi:hypothetical protein
MAGELWRSQVRVGKETVYNTAVTATRRLYLIEPTLNDDAETMFHRFATGTPDNVRASTPGASVPIGRFQVPVSEDELLEALQMTVQGSITPTTPGGGTLAREWVATPSTTIDSVTMEVDDAARPWRATGCYGNSIEIAGDVDGDNLATVELFAAGLTQNALTGAPGERTPTFMRGWETRIYLANFGVDPLAGDAPIGAFLKRWRVRIGRNLGRKYLATNTQAMSGVTLGEFDCETELTVEAVSAQALTEFNNWRAGTKRNVTLEFGQNTQIESAPTNEAQTLTEGTAITAGTFTLTFRGATTGTIGTPWSAALVQAALEALHTIGAGNVSCTGGPLDTAPITVTFVGQLSGLNVPQLTSNQGGLTGTFTHATSTPGVGYKRTVLLTIPGAWRSFGGNETDAGTRMYRLTQNYIYDATLTYGFKALLRNARTTAF